MAQTLTKLSQIPASPAAMGVNDTLIGVASTGPIDYRFNLTQVWTGAANAGLTPVTPEMFGATHDGADDSVSINAAIDYLVSIGGGTLVMGPYTYTINFTIIMRNNINIVGVPGATVIQSFTGIPFSQSLPNLNLRYFNASGIIFIDNVNHGVFQTSGIGLDAAQFCVFEKLQFYGFYEAVRINPTIISGDGSQDAEQFVFNKFSDIYAKGVDFGFYIAGGTNPLSATNVVTANEYSNITIRDVTQIGIKHAYFNDTDSYNNVFIRLNADAAIGVDVAPSGGLGCGNITYQFLTVSFESTVTFLSGFGVRLGTGAPGFMANPLLTDTAPAAVTFVSNAAAVPAYIVENNSTSGITTQAMVYNGPILKTAPTTKTANYTATSLDSSVIFNGGGSLTLTLQTASLFPGRDIWVRTIAAQPVFSSTTNIVPLAGGAAETTLLSGTAGKWAKLTSDGTNWQIMASN